MLVTGDVVASGYRRRVHRLYGPGQRYEGFRIWSITGRMRRLMAAAQCNVVAPDSVVQGRTSSNVVILLSIASRNAGWAERSSHREQPASRLLPCYGAYQTRSGGWSTIRDRSGCSSHAVPVSTVPPMISIFGCARLPRQGQRGQRRALMISRSHRSLGLMAEVRIQRAGAGHTVPTRGYRSSHGSLFAAADRELQEAMASVIPGAVDSCDRPAIRRIERLRAPVVASSWRIDEHRRKPIFSWPAFITSPSSARSSARRCRRCSGCWRSTACAAFHPVLSASCAGQPQRLFCASRRW